MSKKRPRNPKLAKDILAFDTKQKSKPSETKTRYPLEYYQHFT